jgi:hypothetical protein
MMAGHPLLSGLLRCMSSTVVMSLVIYNIMTESSCPSRNATGIQDADVCMLIRLTFWTDYYILIYTNHLELMKSRGGHGSSLLLFTTIMMV